MSLTPLKTNEVWHYLHDNPDKALQWETFISGGANLSMKDISGMSAPELSVLAYALRKRNKNTLYLFSHGLGGHK